MDYLKVRWIHRHPDEPIVLYSELDHNRREIRKVELFANGAIGFASATERTPSLRTKLSITPLPSLEEIAADPEFEPTQILRDEFEAIWKDRPRA